MTANDRHLGEAFVRFAREKLSKDNLPKLRKCLDFLSEEDVWWRAHETNNSVGNLILHLCGNIRQWIISGVGGKEDVRNRPAEFLARGSLTKEDLRQRLEQTLREADNTLASFDVSGLLERRTVQGFDVTCLDAIFHAVEHFSGHTGQIVYITKLRTGRNLKFYDL